MFSMQPKIAILEYVLFFPAKGKITIRKLSRANIKVIIMVQNDVYQLRHS